MKAKTSDKSMISKQELRQQKNRESAERSRKMKDDTIESLQAQLLEYGEKISNLRVENWLIRRSFAPAPPTIHPRAFDHTSRFRYQQDCCYDYVCDSGSNHAPAGGSPPPFPFALGYGEMLTSLSTTHKNGVDTVNGSSVTSELAFVVDGMDLPAQSHALSCSDSATTCVLKGTTREGEIEQQEEDLASRQKRRRQRRMEIMRSKRARVDSASGSSSVTTSSSWYSSSSFAGGKEQHLRPFPCINASSLQHVSAEQDEEMELAAVLAAAKRDLGPKEVRKLKNRLSAERSRQRKLRLIDSLTMQVLDCALQYDDLLQENTALQLHCREAHYHVVTPPPLPSAPVTPVAHFSHFPHFPQGVGSFQPQQHQYCGIASPSHAFNNGCAVAVAPVSERKFFCPGLTGAPPPFAADSVSEVSSLSEYTPPQTASASQSPLHLLSSSSSSSSFVCSPNPAGTTSLCRSPVGDGIAVPHYNDYNECISTMHFVPKYISDCTLIGKRDSLQATPTPIPPGSMPLSPLLSLSPAVVVAAAAATATTMTALSTPAISTVAVEGASSRVAPAGAAPTTAEGTYMAGTSGALNALDDVEGLDFLDGLGDLEGWEGLDEVDCWLH